mgnify:CR=1 FL=1
MVRRPLQLVRDPLASLLLLLQKGKGLAQLELVHLVCNALFVPVGPTHAQETNRYTFDTSAQQQFNLKI